MRPPRLLAACAVGAVLTASTPGAGAPAAPETVIVTASVGSSAAEVMPQKLWRSFVTAAIGARKTVVDDEPTIADEARCRAVHAKFAVLATFDLAPRLPGLAQEPDRIYAIARFTVRNCATGTLQSQRVIELESDPTAQGKQGETPSPASVWEHPIRTALDRAVLIPSRTR